jgi:hypothetical protein
LAASSAGRQEEGQRKNKQASWQPAEQEGKQIEGLKLVFEGLKLASSQFRK